jgi:hypothetical protein
MDTQVVVATLGALLLGLLALGRIMAPEPEPERVVVRVDPEPPVVRTRSDPPRDGR